MIKKQKLGEMLINAGYFNKEELNQALDEQKTTNVKLGEYLIQKGLIKEHEIVDLISKQLGIPKYEPHKYPFDIRLESVVPPDVVQKYKLVPLQKKGNLLTIAMTDPLDINALDAVEVLTNLEVEPVICTEHEFFQLTSSIYGMTSGLGQVMESVEDLTVEGDSDVESKVDVQVRSLQDMAEEAPVIRLVNSIFSQAVREGASDIHISPEKNYTQLRFRVDGKLREVPSPPKSLFLPMVSRIKILSNMDIAVSRIPQDGRFTFMVDNKEVNVRASSIPTIYGENMVLRLLEKTSRGLTLEELGMVESEKEKIEQVIQKPYGLILSTGPTGSGKTTTLYAILRRINQPDINIMTLEDPVEYRVPKIRQIQLNRKAGMTFASGLRSVLRQDPDVIMVGEVRDHETAAITVQSAMTGHKVLSTVHTNDAASAITRFIDMGIEPYLVSSVLLVSIAQRLVRTICPFCKEPYEPPEKALATLNIEDTSNANFMHGAGCYRCNNTGFLGRTGVFEILLIDSDMEELILKQASANEITRAALQAGKLRTLRENAADKVLKGVTTLEEAISAVII